MTVARGARSRGRVRWPAFAQDQELEPEQAPGRLGRRLLLCLREHLPCSPTRLSDERAVRDFDSWSARRMRQSAVRGPCSPTRRFDHCVRLVDFVYVLIRRSSPAAL